MSDTGIRLQLHLGAEKASPAPAEVIDALLDIEVTNKDRELDGFEMKFSLGRNALGDYDLLQNHALDPNKRVIIVAIVGVFSQVLIDGVITQNQVSLSNRPGESMLIVTGEDLGAKLNEEEERKTNSQQTDSEIVESVLKKYKKYSIEAKITKTKEKPPVSERTPSQCESDLHYIRRLAQRNGFIFYFEPTKLGKSIAYWGPENRRDTGQPALILNMAAFTNVDAPLTIRFNALGPAETEVKYLDPKKKSTVQVRAASDDQRDLSRNPAKPLRKIQLCNTAHLSNSQAELRAHMAGVDTANAVTVTGELDTVRYGSVLRSRRLVYLCGVGGAYNDLYYVQKVIHRIKRGQYQQSFTLTREGHGTRENKVPPAAAASGALSIKVSD